MASDRDLVGTMLESWESSFRLDTQCGRKPHLFPSHVQGLGLPPPNSLLPLPLSPLPPPLPKHWPGGNRGCKPPPLPWHLAGLEHIPAHQASSVTLPALPPSHRGLFCLRTSGEGGPCPPPHGPPSAPAHSPPFVPPSRLSLKFSFFSFD